MTNRNILLWPTIILLTLVFFLSQYTNNLNISLEKGIPVANILVSGAEEGNLLRQVSFSILAAYGIFLIIATRYSEPKIRGAVAWTLIIYLVWAFLSLTWSGDIRMTLRKIILLGAIFIGAYGTTKIFSRKEFILWILICSLSYLLIGIVIEIISGKLNPLEIGYRFSGITHPNQQGINCALLVISSQFCSRNIKRWRFQFVIISIIGFIFLVLTGSRTALFSTIISFLIYYVFIRKNNTIKIFIYLCVAITFICFMYMLYGSEVSQTFRNIVYMGRLDPNIKTFAGRTTLWEDCINDFFKMPITGYGYASYLTPDRIVNLSRINSWGVGEVHSAYLEILMGIGIVGLTLFMITFIKSILKYYNQYKELKESIYAYLLILLLFCFYNGMLESALINNTILTFILFYILVSIEIKRRYKYGK